MEDKKKNPVLAGLISLIPTAITTISTLIKDKREKKDALKDEVAITVPVVTTGEAIVDSLKDMVGGSISSKRVLNIGGTTVIIMIAIANINANGLTKLNLALIIVGAAYSLGMSLITWLSERK